jgi:hypothetical protein
MSLYHTLLPLLFAQNVLHRGRFLPVERIQLEGIHGNVTMPPGVGGIAGSTTAMNPLLVSAPMSVVWCGLAFATGC